MNMKEVMVNRNEYRVSVRYGIGPFKKEDINSININKIPYLLMGIISQKGNIRIVLGDVQDHKELRRVLREDIVGEYSCEFGQVWLDNGLVKRITLHHTESEGIDDSETEKEISLIMSVFSPDLLRSEGVNFTYNATKGDKWIYVPQSRKIIKHLIRNDLIEF